jgi:UDP-N-acetylglucosamine 2-epimerase (non-hydrolysing)
MKVAPLMRSFRQHPEISALLVHTGQHYDAALSDVFFKDLEIPRPDVDLEVGSASHAAQTAQVMIKLEPVLKDFTPDVVVVVGDVNSTMAASLTAVKLSIPVAHVEAGLRSFDRNMPEEINRVVTDAVSSFLFVTEPEAISNLLNEGKSRDSVFHVGNVMVDTLLSNLPRIDCRTSLDRLGLRPGEYVLATIHRPSNVDSSEDLQRTVSILDSIQRDWKLVFPVHPRTRVRLSQHSLERKIASLENISLIEPLGYLDFLKLVKESRLVLTDSGGIQEETTVLGVPCLTMRENTERPITVTQGTNQLVGNDPGRILDAFREAVSRPRKSPSVPEYWDGHAADRITGILSKKLGGQQQFGSK